MVNYKIGIDLGGTKLLGVLVDQHYKIIKTKKIILSKKPSIEKIIEDIVQIYNDLSNQLPIKGFGLAVPSSIQYDSGVASFLPAYGWRNVPFKRLLESKIKIKVRLDNDVNLATLAEHTLGAGKGVQSLYTFYPGTGIGGGYISEGMLVRGLNGTAGEIGHMVIDINGVKCNCGQTGCLETIVSNTGFKRMLNEAKTKGELSILHHNCNITSEQISNAWEVGDIIVKNILKYQAEVLGIAIANVINTIGVERVIIGGQLYHLLKDELLPIVKKFAYNHAIGDGMKNVDILLNQLGPEAPAIGATLL